MFGYVLGWVILMIRPSWVFLFAFTVTLMVFSAIGILGRTAEPTIVVAAVLISGAMFMIVGGPIVAIRLWLRSRATKKDKELDAELARIRAEASERQGRPPE